jgi:hypothetical protein
VSLSDIPRSRDGSPNWAADTDPVGPVTPELALVDPELAHSGEINSEVTMSSMQFGDGTTFGAGEPALTPLQGAQAAPLQPIPPLAPAAPAPEAAAPVPAEPAPGVPVGDMRDVPLGTLVFRAGLLPEEQLEEALHEGMKTGKRLGEVLLERGMVSENDLGRLLAGQKGLPFVELDPAAVDPTAPPLLHPEKARLHGALPIGFEGGVPVVAVTDPSNDLVVENVRRALACEPVLVVAGREALSRAISHAYGATSEVPPPDAVPAPEAPAAEPVAAVQPVVAFQQTDPEPAAPEPVAPAQVAPAVEALQPTEPVATQPVQNGDGLWLGQPAVQPVVPEALTVETFAPQPEVVQPLPEPVAPVMPAEPAAAMEPVAAAPVAQTEVPEAVADVPLPWLVAVRLADGERIEVASFSGEAEAAEGARGVVAQIATEGTWPFFAGRFIRPEVIVSVDLVRNESVRWLGSSARAAAWDDSRQQPTG